MNTTKYKLKGLHVIMAANQKGGVSKSTAIGEFAAAFRQLGIDPIVATLESAEDGKKKNDRLERLIRGYQVHEIKGEDVKSAGMSLGEVFDIAELGSGLIMLDVPGSLFNRGNELMARVLRTRLVDDIDTMTMLAPVSNERDEFGFAQMFLESADEAGLPAFETWYRGWSRPQGDFKLSELKEWKSIQNPKIEVDCRHTREIDVLEATDGLEKIPGLCHLREWYYQTGKDTLHRFDRKAVEGILKNLDGITDFIEREYKPLIKNER